MRLSDFYNLTDKGYAHNSLVIYERLLGGLDVKNILEVGVLNGDSIRMWASVYPEASVVGVDINDTSSIESEFDNVTIYTMDAYSAEGLKHLGCEKYDLIVDDGPHTLKSQCIAAAEFPFFLKRDGLLVIEDIASIEEAHTIQNFVSEEFSNSTYIIDRRSAPCDYPYNRFYERNEIFLVVDRRIR